MIYPEDIPLARQKFSLLEKNKTNSVKAELRIKHQRGDWISMEAIAINMLETTISINRKGKKITNPI